MPEKRWMTQAQAEMIQARAEELRLKEGYGGLTSILTAIREATLRPGDAGWCYPQIGQICPHYKWDDGMRCKHPDYCEGRCPRKEEKCEK